MLPDAVISEYISIRGTRISSTSDLESLCRAAWMKTAENQLPQSDMVTSPDRIDTLAEEQLCPICGSSMRDGQCQTCFVPGTMVRVREGYVPIETIEVGDEVLSENGQFNEVLEVMENDFNGMLLEIDTHNSTEPIRVTPEHPFKAVAGKHASWKSRPCGPGKCGRLKDGLGYDKWGNVTVTHGLDWVEASQLTTDSWLTLNSPDETVDLDTVTVPEHFRGCKAACESCRSNRGKSGPCQHKTSYVRRGPLEYELTPEFLWNVGLYIAEGSAGSRSINYALHSEETHFQQRVIDFWEDQGFTTRVTTKENHNGVWIDVNSSTLAEWFPVWLGSGSHNKRIPEVLLNLPDDKLAYVIQGILDGDGGKTHNRTFGQTSKHLAMQVSEYALRRGWTPTVALFKKEGRKDVYKVHGADTLIAEKQQTRKPKYSWQYLGETLTKVKSIKEVPYWGKVYNLRVAGDPTYTVQNILVHNCGFTEPPEGFDNPNLEKANEVDQAIEQQKAEQAATQEGQQPVQNAQQPEQQEQMSPAPQQAMSSAQRLAYARKLISSNRTAANHGGKINPVERPILPASKNITDKPVNPKTIKDSLAPVESSIHVSEPLIDGKMCPECHNTGWSDKTTKDGDRLRCSRVGCLAVLNKNRQMNPKNDKESSMTTKLAEGASPASPEPGKRVDPEATGGVVEAPEAKHEDVNKETDIERIHTDTWHGDKGDSLGQHEPVTTEAWKAESSKKEADLGEPKAEHLDVETPPKEQTGDNTETFGSDKFHITDPVTSEAWDDDAAKGGKESKLTAEKVAAIESAAQARLLNALKLARQEVALGLITAADEFNRASELERETPETLTALAGQLKRAKTAGVLQASRQPLKPVIAAKDGEYTGGLPAITASAPAEAPKADALGIIWS